MNNPLHIGLDYVKKAIQFDQENKLQEAVENYSLSLNYFLLVLKDPSQQNTWAVVQQKIQEYQSRRDILQEELKLAQLQIKTSEPKKEEPKIQPKKEEPKKELSLNDILEKALNLLDRAKSEHSKNNKEIALDLYTESLDNFFYLYNNETDLNLKKDYENYLLTYTDRAEKLKEEIKNVNQPKTVNINVQNQYPYSNTNQYPNSNTNQYPLTNTNTNQYPISNNNQYPLSNDNNNNQPIVKNSQFQEYLKVNNILEKGNQPYETTAKKDFAPRKGELILTIKVEKTTFFIGEEVKVHIICNNFSPKKVHSLKIYLKMTEDRYAYSKDKPKTNRETKKINPLIFTAGNVFPLEKGLKWRGDAFYKLSAIGGIEPTKQEVQVLDRNYVIVVSCVLKRAKNMHADIPIILKEMSKEQEQEFLEKERQRKLKEEELRKVREEEERIQKKELELKMEEERLLKEQIIKQQEEEQLLRRKEETKKKQEELYLKDLELKEKKVQQVRVELQKNSIPFESFIQLEDMGIVSSLNDYDRACQLLVKHKGNINLVADELIK